MLRCFLSGCLLAAWLPGLLLAQADARRIQVRATGEVTAAADELRLPLEILTEGKDIAKIKQQNDQLLQQIFELAAAHDVPRPVIEATSATFNFQAEQVEGKSVSPKGQNQNAGKGKNDDPFGDGDDKDAFPLSMSRRLTLRFKSLNQATDLLVKLTKMDAVRSSREVRLSRLQAHLKDPASHQQQARLQAVRLCKQKAELLAEASELRLGAAENIFDDGEGVTSGPRFSDDPFGDPFGADRRHGGPDEAASPIQLVAYQADDDEGANVDRLPPGHVKITVTVRIIYEAVRAK